MIYRIVILTMCHLIGDYGIHREFISVTKGENWYHMFVHCVLYCVPFALLFGLNFELLYIFVVHVITDSLKARYNKIGYVTDQICHYIALLLYLI